MSEENPTNRTIDSVEAVRRLLARGRTKHGIEMAKRLVKVEATEERVELLVSAYFTRAAELTAKGLTAEAAVIDGLARDRFPAVYRRVRQAGPIDHGTPVDELLAALSAPGLAVDQTRALEARLRAELVDPRWLVRSKHLPAAHPLRAQADDLLAALLVAASSGPPPEAVALSGISRRSPLAPWKAFVSALAAYHRGDDDVARRWIDAVDADSPARAGAEAIRRLLEPAPAADAAPVAGPSLARVSGARPDPGALRSAFAALDGALDAGKPAEMLRAIRHARETCARDRPELLDALRRVVVGRCMGSQVTLAEQRSALGGLPLADAACFRQLARSAEVRLNPYLVAALWEQFAEHAVAEGMFAVGGPEMAALCLRVARLLSKLPFEARTLARTEADEDMGQLEAFYEGQPEAIARVTGGRRRTTGVDFTSVLALFRRAAGLGTREVFLAWFNELDARHHVARSEWDELVEVWKKTLPGDARPCVIQAEHAMERGAMDSAFVHVNEALARDPLDPEIKKLRPCVAFGRFIANVKAERPQHLDRDLAELAAVPADGDFPEGLLQLLGLYALAAWVGDKKELQSVADDLAAHLGKSGTAFIGYGLGIAAGRRKPLPRPPARLDKRQARMFAEVARAYLVATRLDLEFELSPSWAAALTRALDLPGATEGLAARSLDQLAEAAVELDHHELVHAITVRGLQMDLPDALIFLCWRVEAVEDTDLRRAQRAIRAAKVLALIHRGAEATARVQVLHDELIHPRDRTPKLALTEEQARAVLAEEAANRKLPPPPDDSDDDYDDDPFDGIEFFDAPEVLEQLFPKGPKRSPKGKGKRG